MAFRIANRANAASALFAGCTSAGIALVIGWAALYWLLNLPLGIVAVVPLIFAGFMVFFGLRLIVMGIIGLIRGRGGTPYGR